MNYKLSIVVPLNNEAENLPELAKRLHQTCCQLTDSYEMIFVNDGSDDDSEKVLEQIHQEYEHVTVINLLQRGGKAAALERGFEKVTGDYAVIIDSDLQHLPEDIPKLIEKMEEGSDVVSGQRVDRHDNGFKVFTSRLFNIVVRLFVDLDFKDYFSGLKCFRMSMMRRMNVYGDLYRFVAVMAHQKGFKAVEVPIAHHDRAHGLSKYNFFSRLTRGIQDLVVIIFAIVIEPADRYKYYSWGLFAVMIGIILILIEFMYSGAEEFSFRHGYGLSAVIVFIMAFFFYVMHWAIDYFYKIEEQARIMRKTNVKTILESK